MPQPPTEKQNRIIDSNIRFVNKKHKMELLKQGRKLNGSNVYLQRYVTKKQNKTKTTHTYNYKCKTTQKTGGNTKHMDTKL